MRAQDHCASQRKCDDPRVLGNELAVGHVQGVGDAPEGVDNVPGLRIWMFASEAPPRRGARVEAALSGFDYDPVRFCCAVTLAPWRASMARMRRPSLRHYKRQRGTPPYRLRSAVHERGEGGEARDAERGIPPSARPPNERHQPICHATDIESRDRGASRRRPYPPPRSTPTPALAPRFSPCERATRHHDAALATVGRLGVLAHQLGTCIGTGPRPAHPAGRGASEGRESCAGTREAARCGA